MPNITQYDAGDRGIRPSDAGTDARVTAGRKLNALANQEASALDTLARETERQANATRALGRDTQQLGRDTEQLGGETAALGSRTGAAFDSVGRSVGSAIAVAGNAVERYLDHKQISEGSARWSELTDQVTKAWNERVKSSDPNDPTVAKTFMDSLEERLDKFKEEGFYTENGRLFAEAKTTALRQHMQEKTAGDMATLAGEAAKTNQRQTVNSLSSTVHSDPSSLDFSLAALKTSTEALIATSPNLTGAQAARLRSDLMQGGSESIIKSAAIGYIQKTGQVPKWATDPKYSAYINGAELKTFEQAAKSYQRLDAAESRAARQQRDYEARNDFNKQVNQLEIDTLPKEPGGKPVLPSDYWSRLRDLSNHPGAQIDPGRLKTMVDNGERITERINKPEPLGPISHATTIDILDRIQSTDPSRRMVDNKPIYEAYGKNLLNSADFAFLQKEFAQARTPEGEQLNTRTDEFLKAISPQLDKSVLGSMDTFGKEAMYRFTFDLKAKINEYRKAGKNPYDLLDPSKPDYMGKPEAISPYQSSLQETLLRNAARMRGAPLPTSPDPGAPPRPAPPQRKPGESAADYLKRVGGG